jgi:hypothetical protein
MRLVTRLIQKATPRIVTLEQSDAFLNSSNVEFLGAVLLRKCKLEVNLNLS